MIDLLLAFAASAAVPLEGPTAVCTNMARIEVPRGSWMEPSVTRGGATRVTVSGRTDSGWSVEELSRTARYAPGQIVLERDGVRVRHARHNGRRGFLASDRAGRLNFFTFGGFRSTSANIAFFRRVDFSAAGRAACRRRG